MTNSKIQDPCINCLVRASCIFKEDLNVFESECKFKFKYLRDSGEYEKYQLDYYEERDNFNNGGIS